jgi:hypothetical protein
MTLHITTTRRLLDALQRHPRCPQPGHHPVLRDMEEAMRTHTQRLSCSGTVLLHAGADGTTIIEMLGVVRNPLVHDPRPAELVLTELRRQGLIVELSRA